MRRWTAGVLWCLVLAGCQRSATMAPAEGDPPASSRAEQPEPEKSKGEAIAPVSAAVYFPDQELRYLEAEAPELAADPQQPPMILEEALRALLAGPTEEAHTRVIPEGVKLNKVLLRGDLAIVDLSRNFATDFQGGSDAANLAAYSVIHTAGSVPGVKRVQILLDGDPAGDFGGVIDLSNPLEPDPSLVGGKKVE
ncbi:MAG: GerMN domain-containing protein [Fimbriimonadaceae bacterium]|nr:GerMN domain-containing protein [Fimbriimonadaceae bacterium]